MMLTIAAFLFITNVVDRTPIDSHHWASWSSPFLGTLAAASLFAAARLRRSRYRDMTPLQLYRERRASKPVR